MTALFPVHAVAAAVGWLLLTVAVVRQRRPTSSARIVAGAGSAIAVVFALGCAIYPHYRADIKPMLLTDWPTLALAFETKEHLAAMALCCVLGGAGSHLAAGHTPEGHRAARALLGLGWVLCTGVAVLGIAITWTP